MAGSNGSKPENNWSIYKTPSPHQTDPIGSYSNGCLAGAQMLPQSGDGFISIRRERNRFYGHPSLIRFITELGQHINHNHHKKLLIGDLSQARGGRMNYGHSSHQTGLDVDVWFTTESRQTPLAYREDFHFDSLVDKAKGQLAKPVNLELRDALYFSATHPDVARIFVNPVIKQALCQSENNPAWLRKLRPWWGHDEHFHIRLNCPKGSLLCEEQATIPAGSGCNQSLNDWVIEQSDLVTGKIKRKPNNKKKRKKELPEACTVVFQK